MALVVWHVQDALGRPLGGALIQGHGTTLGDWQGQTNNCGDFISDLGADHYDVLVTHADATPRSLPADILDCGVIVIGLEPLPPPILPPLMPLIADGPIFRVAQTGSPWRWKLATMFKAPQRWMDGEDLSRIVEWTKAVGANGWRVFLQHAYLDSFAPDWPEMPWIMPIEQVRPFVDWMAEQGLYVEIVVLCDCQCFQLDDSEQVARVQEVLTAIGGTSHVFVEICNEPSENGCDPSIIADALNLWDSANRPCLMALGLYPVTGHEPNFPVLDYVGDHPQRKPEWPAECGKTGHYQYEQTGVVCLSDEPPKFSEPGADPEATEQDPVKSPENAEDAGGGFGLGSAGATFHCRNGIDALLPGELETTCAQRFFAAMDVFPEDAVLGVYEHDGTAGNPLVAINDPHVVGEVASRICGSTAYSAAAQPTTAWNAVPQNGWRWVERIGDRGTLMVLER